MPEIKIKTVFDWGTEVYVKTDTTQQRGIIVTIAKEWNGGVIYRVKFCDDDAWYQAIELSTDKGEATTTPKETDDEDE